MKIRLLILSIISIGLSGHASSQQVFSCPPCGMECDNQTYDEGGVCPHSECTRILQWKDVPSLMWPRMNASNEKLLFTLTSSGANRIHEYRDGRIVDLNLEGENASYSPDGSKILYSSNDQIFIYSNGRVQNISKEHEVKGSASWLSNEELALTIGSFPTTKIYAISLETGDERLLSDFKGFNYGVSASTGGVIAFSSLRKGLYVLADKGPVLIHRHGEYASFSSDGKKIAFHARDGERFNIYTCNLDGSNLVKIKSVEGYDSELPSWSKDGSEIYFMSNKRHGNWDIYKMKADGSSEVLLLKSESFN